MKKLLMMCLTFGALFTTNACGVEQNETLSEEAQEITISSGVWYAYPKESCPDWFMQPCTATVPDPALRCPAGSVVGGPCDNVGHQCLKVHSSSYFSEFICGAP